MLKDLIGRLTQETPTSSKKSEPRIFSRADHNISRSHISPNALKVLYRLHNEGFNAYLVGGCVRDLLLGFQPKDFDIATNAHPEEVRKLFKNCRLIGKRFRLAHILFGKEIIEVATFRTHHEQSPESLGKSHKGMIVRDNVYGSIEDDAWRRDFTLNALYYNIADFTVIDYVGAMEDIQTKTLRIIGDPGQRYHEDPVRLLRAVRFMGKLNVNIAPETETPIIPLSHLVSHVSSSRLFQEVLKIFRAGALHPTFKLLQKYHLFAKLFPQTAGELSRPETLKLIEEALMNTDKRVVDGKTTSPAFFFSVLLWRPILHQANLLKTEEGMSPYLCFEKAIRSTLKAQVTILAIPRRLQTSVHDICMMQHRFTYRHGARPFRLLEHPRFRAALDLLLLRSHAGESVTELSTWWMEFAAGDQQQRERLSRQFAKNHRGHSKNASSRHELDPVDEPGDDD